jgi:TonB family protein
MKTIYFLIPIFIFPLATLCQKPPKDKYSMPFKKVRDTTFAYVDYQGTIVNLPGMPYMRKTWPENGKWKEVLIDQAEYFMARSGWYKDPELQVKDGGFEEFYAKGKPKSTATYVNNKKEGSFKAFYEDGKPMEVYTYLAGLPVDSALEYHEDGSIKFRGFFDKSGTGSGIEYYKGGKEKLSGPVKAGKRDGTWLVKDEAGAKIMEVSFMADSLTKTTCFTADGKAVAKGDCVFEQPAAFPGGEANWTKFLQKNLRYPNDAFKKGIQGIVRIQFIVDKDGSVGELNVLTSPDKSLSNEVLRLMRQSPDWIPAIQYNKNVIYRHIQAITFRLE